MKCYWRRLNNEDGIVLGVSLIMLGIFTVLGLSSIIFTTTELQIASNEQFHKMAFYGAEAARGYVPNNIQLYGIRNITVDQGLNFPNIGNADEKQSLNSNQAFNGNVTYIGAIEPPRGSGVSTTPVSKARTCWVRRANLALSSVGMEKGSSHAQVNMDCTPPRTLASAS